MRGFGCSRGEKGFTLVEILVVAAILGLVIGSIYGLFIAHQRSAYDQGDVVDLQQNLRIAMDKIGRDIHLAGFLVSGNAVSNDPANPDSTNPLTLQTASEFGAFARIDLPSTGPSEVKIPSDLDSADHYKFPVYSVNLASNFASGDTVRIIRPSSDDQPISATFTVYSTNMTATPNTMTITFPTTYTATYLNGDMIVKTNDSTPAQVQYYLANNQIYRQTKTATGTLPPDVVASNIKSNGFSCTYLDDTGSPTSTLANIRAVQVTLKGEITGRDGNTHSRTLTDVFSILN